MEVQERILDTAFGLFRQYGTRSITMDDIAIKMGISKKTLYAHFEDKDDLVMNAIARYLQHMQDACVVSHEQGKDAIEALFRLMEILEEHTRNMNPVILLDLQKFHSRAYRLFQHYKDHYLKGTIRENLQRGISEGLYRADINVEVLTEFRTTSSLLCFQPELFSVSGFDMSHVQKVLLEHFLYGVASLKGFKLIELYKEQLLKK
ncbi:TetR/AcrR family transcriptional regulator [Chitinophaga pendula]|uniref:TetR/AcrR family transcriptional regulator n=1 Tax=Chitinophaga TaxID=79328 RepID=UPI000BB0A629|nr:MULTISPECIES: TetR/AcrR family transcriptional regulator [Chitinophaga]ASZ10763.1 TetR family transcriptional regulator [Chitinophaga sp. MD30]UCJ06259.1 TetR/AcrR family transcriptional regulator [Chitinophaga pendula]